MKKSLAILLSVCLVLSTVVGCFTFTASADEAVNLFTGGDFEEFSTGSTSANPHFVYSGAAQGDQGWRCISMQMGVNGATAAKDTTTAHSGSASFGIQAYWGKRGVSRQLELTAGKSYAISFYYKGALAGGFKVVARQSVLDGDDGKSGIASTDFWTGTNIASMSVDTTQTASDWTLVEGTFTLPEGYPVANIILAYGQKDGVWGYIDDIVLVEVVQNLWDVDGAPDQSQFGAYNGDFFSGEGTGVPNKNYVFGQNGENDHSPKYAVSPYGWRGYGLSANAGQRAARMDDSGGINYYHTAPCGFIVQFTAGGSTKRAVSRQIQLEAGKSYSLSFWFKGQAKGFDITALDQIYNYHVPANNDSIITSISDDITAAYSDVSKDDTWGYITVTFTMPEDKSVANFILGEGYDTHGAYDEFLLVESEPEASNLWAVEGAPDQSEMGAWNDGYFAGEGDGSNKNYILGESNSKVSSYGWRGLKLAANAKQRAGRYDYNGDGQFYHSGTCGFIVDLAYDTRGVSRQIQLEAGKSYTFSFYFKGYVQGFDVQALSAITNNHESGGTSLITSISSNLSSTDNAYGSVGGSTWEYVTVNFTMPSDKSVANFILATGSGTSYAAFDDFLLVESKPYVPDDPQDPQDPEDPEFTGNYWDSTVTGAPDQSGMEGYGTSFFSGEFTSGGNKNYIYGQKGKDDTTPVYGVSPYGWRGYGLAANADQRAACMDNSGGIYCNKNGIGGFILQLKWSQRAVSRQIQLTAGKSYSLSFWFKGRVDGFDIKALDKIYDYHVSDGDSIVTSVSADMRGESNAYSSATGNTWEYITVTFTMPEDKSVANFILGEENNNGITNAAFDDFLLVESAAVLPNLFTGGDFEEFSTGSNSANPHYVYDTANQGDKGWRSTGLAMGVNGQRGAKWDAEGYNSSNSFAIQFWSSDRGVSRQLTLSDDTTYYFTFYYKGTLPGGVKVIARQSVQNGDDGKTGISDESFWKGTNIANMTVNTKDTAEDWTKVEGIFTLPAGFPVANIVLSYGNTGKDGIGLIDDFELYKATNVAMVKAGLTINGSQPYPSFSGGNTASVDKSIVNKGEEVTLTATVASGYSFAGWYNGDQLVSSDLVATTAVSDDTNFIAKFTYSGTLNYWDGGDMETLSDKYTYIGNNIVNGYNDDGWLTYNTGNGANTRALADTSTVHSGVYSLKLEFSGGVRALGRRFKLQNGHSYKLTFWAYGSDNGFGIYNHDSATTPFICDNKDWGIMANKANSYEIVRTHANGKTGWTQYSFCFTLTEGDYVDIAWCTISGGYYIDDVVLTDHTHTWGDLIAETDSTCSKEGAVAHYECTDCPTGLCGVGNEQGTATNWKYLVKPLLAHTLSYNAAQSGSCDEDSSIAHYSCDVCGKLFADAEGTQELTHDEVFIAATGHVYNAEEGSEDYTEGVARTCTTDGYEGYFTCEKCGQLFDVDGNEIDAPIVLPKFHSAEGATVYKATVPSYSSDGNLTYYQCPNPSGCVNGTKKYSLDPDFTTTYTKRNAEAAAKLACLADEGEMPLEYGGLTLDGEIGFNLFVDVIDNYQDAYGIEEASIEIYGIDAFDANGDFIPGSTPVATLDGNNPGIEGEGAFANYYRPATPITVRADQMNDKIAIMLYDTSTGDKEPVADFHDNGVLEISAIDILKQYIDTFENDTQIGSAEITRLSKACITYGGYATSYFDKTAYADPGNTPSNLPYDLDISTVTNEVVDAIPGATRTGAATGFSIKSASFLVLAKSAVRFYYELADGQSISDYNIAVTIGGVAVDSSNIVISQNSGGQAYIQVANIGASDLSKELVIRVTNKSDATYVQASYNALCYVKNQINNSTDEQLKDLCKAILLYSNAADAYAAVVA